MSVHHVMLVFPNDGIVNTPEGGVENTPEDDAEKIPIQ